MGAIIVVVLSDDFGGGDDDLVVDVCGFVLVEVRVRDDPIERKLDCEDEGREAAVCCNSWSCFLVVVVLERALYMDITLLFF